MFTCVICRFDIELDDAVAPTTTGLCVCVRCFGRETGSARSVEPELRREVIAVLVAMDAVGSLE